MKHPSEAALALYAGGDLGWLARWNTERHLQGCGRCRAEVESYADIRDGLSELAELPGIAWNRLASEMKANIRLGLEAGACVRNENLRPGGWVRIWTGGRAAVAYACLVALVVAAVVLERPAPAPAERAEGVVLQATHNGIELKEGAQALSLLHTRTNDDAGGVIYSVGAQGSLKARYVDSDTGYVTINNVYAQ